MSCWGEDVQARVDGLREELLALSHFIHDNPEIGLQEHKASAEITALLEKHGVSVQRGLCGFDTAFIATAEGCEPGPHVAILAEYDALPNIGHGCGHNVIATCSVGAFLAVCSQRDKFRGRVSLIGTPAEENFGAKRTMLEKGVFDDVDYAMMIHPSAEKSLINRSGRGSSTIKVRFIGKSAHSALSHQGINALSAVILLFNSIDQMRPTFRPTDNVNGVILDGGHAANIVPGEATCAFSLRANKRLELEELAGKIRRAAEAAASVIGAKVEFKIQTMGYERYPNLPMSEAFKANMEKLGEEMEYADPNRLYGSSDINDVSVFVPVIHDYLRISTRSGINEHSREFAEDAASARADEICIKGAKGLAMTALDILNSGELREKIQQYQKDAVPAEYLQRKYEVISEK